MLFRSMYKADPKGGYEIVLKRNPSNEVHHADTEEAAKAWIRAKIASGLKKSESVEEGGPGDEPEHPDADSDDKRWDDVEETKVEETKMSKEVMEMRRLAGLPLNENYVYAQEEDDGAEPSAEQPDAHEPTPDDKAEYDQEGRSEEHTSELQSH